MKASHIKRVMSVLNGERESVLAESGVPSNLIGKDITLKGFFVDHPQDVRGVIRVKGHGTYRVEVPEFNGAFIIVTAPEISVDSNGNLVATSKATGKATIMSGTKVIAADDTDESPDGKDSSDNSEAVSMGTKTGAAKGDKLKVLITKEDHTFVDKLYAKYISETDFSHKPAFTQALDKLIVEFRGNEPLNDSDVDDFLSEDGTGDDNTDSSDTANPQPSANTNDEDNSDNSLDNLSDNDDSGDEDEDPSKSEEVAAILEEQKPKKLVDRLDPKAKRIHGYFLRKA